MPAFVTNGPDIPEVLLQRHEEGRVVFFCGAGISRPAGLPDFAGLVTALYRELSVSPNAIQRAAIKKGQFDTAIGLLERDHIGGREAVRRALASILTPDLTSPDATTTHEALLTLACNRKGQLRLVTTNFDRLFEKVLAGDAERFTAPLLPAPKNRWNGLVYLHGLLSPMPNVSQLDRLVVSSGDFGLAYLAERWAARFVTDLFRNYSICFVGYAIDDPVLRYMMDALAADRLLGESPPEMFAFGSCAKGKETARSDEWRAKNVTPILYREGKTHAYLHKTLREWANVYRDGVHAKEMIIAQHATTPPVGPSPADFAVGRVLWALTDELAAKHFADLDPVAPLEWLEPLSRARFGHEDLSRFGVAPNAKRDDGLSFSAVLRPAPYTRAPKMCFADMGERGSDWDGVMLHLACWLTRHLGDPKLVLWLAKQGGQLHERLADLIRRQIEKLYQLEQEGKEDEIGRILAAAPKAVPGPAMRTLWRLMLSGRVTSHAHCVDFYDWLGQVKRDGLTPILRMELRQILKPYVMLREPFRWDQEAAESPSAERIRDLVEWDIVLAGEGAHSALRDLKDIPAWLEALPGLLGDCTVLLRDVLDLMSELGKADQRSDLSYIDQPSISEHPQNMHFHDWTVLIELTRDAWLATAKADPAQARLMAEVWWQVPYPLFKRLVFFAATNSSAITARESSAWLLANDAWWLWSVGTQREAIRLLVALTRRLDAQPLGEIERAILLGPPREMLKDDIEPERLKIIVDHEIWLRLAKVKAAGATLGQSATSRLDELTRHYPDWQLAEDEHDEFPFWMDEGDADRKPVATPRLRHDLMEWLRQPRTPCGDKDDWHQRCREDFRTTARVLIGLARNGEWPIGYWREALQAWSEGKLLSCSWRYMAKVVNSAPDHVRQELSFGLSWWLHAQAKTFESQERLFFSLSRGLLELECEGVYDGADNPVSRAINHPVGLVTEALLDWWYRQELRDSQGLKGEVRSLFMLLCNTGVNKFRHGRVLLAAHIIALFRVDAEWTKTHLLPLFNWKQSEVEANLAWQGFLWSPRLYAPLLKAIKLPLLETARHYTELGMHAGQYADFLTFVAMDRGDIFTIRELAKTTRMLPAEGLERAARAIVRVLEGAGEQRAEYWDNRVRPYLASIWPTSQGAKTPMISQHFARLCVAAREAFPKALEVLRPWLQKGGDPHYLIRLLDDAKLCAQFPPVALEFLDVIVGDNIMWSAGRLKQCLDDIANAPQGLVDDPRFGRLAELCRRHGSS